MNDGRPPERWILALDVRDDGALVAVTTRRLITHIWRAWGIRCKGFSEHRRMHDRTVDSERLRRIIDGITAEKRDGAP
jgi:hypothetical protein